jgi:hypothetical protein
METIICIALQAVALDYRGRGVHIAGKAITSDLGTSRSER